MIPTGAIEPVASGSAWYTIVTDPVASRADELDQGDILLGFPIPVISGLAQWPPPETLGVAFDERDVVVLTQSCDLANGKTNNVILAEVSDWAYNCQFDANMRAQRTLEAVQRGNIPKFSLLHEHKADPFLPWSVANFSALHIVPRELISGWLAERSGQNRLRLISPYREHLSQAFARYFMRVGLPHDAKGFVEAFKKKG